MLGRVNMIKFPKTHIPKIHIVKKEYEDATIKWDKEYSLFRKLHGKNKTLEDWLEYIKKEEMKKLKNFQINLSKKGTKKPISWSLNGALDPTKGKNKNIIIKDNYKI